MLLRGTKGTVTCGHTDRKYLAAGRCGPCYERLWMRRHHLDRKEYFWERNLKHRFGKTKQWYKAKLKSQKHKCALCGSKTAQRRKSKRLFVDHIKGTKTTRGLLCHQCNRVLGIFKDSPALFEKAARYLRRYAK